MPLYIIEKTAQKGQVLLVSTDKRGMCPIISLQMPEQRARQIVAALEFVEQLSHPNIDPMWIGTDARQILAMPIEKT